LQELYTQREKLENIEEKIINLNKKENMIKNTLLKKAKELSKIRKKYADDLEKRLKFELKDLAMEDLSFKVSFNEKEIGERGIDRIEFLISPNRGEAMRSLSKIASGGELSRIMLALKTITAGLDQVDTLVFDEVDSGVGGETAARMAEKLLQISQDAGSNHYLIRKEKGENRTYTRIKSLSSDERVKEIARMIGGTVMTDKTIAHAEEMLDMAALNS
jgi:DNA repair protein RecN (Recombination protein N)